MVERYVDIGNDGITEERKKLQLVRRFRKVSELEEGILVWPIKDESGNIKLNEIKGYIEGRLNNIGYRLEGFENSIHNKGYAHFHFKKQGKKDA